MSSLLCFLVLATAGNPQPTYSFMIFDWWGTYQNFNVFKERVDQCKEVGFDTMDISVSWKSVEPKPGVWDFTEIDKRVDYIRSKGMKIRLRLNVSYAHGWPDWYPGVICTAKDGTTPEGVLSPFSPNAPEHWARFGEAVSAHYKDKIDCYQPTFGMHVEVKFGAWITYEPEAKRAFRKWLGRRYATIDKLNMAWGTKYASFDVVEPPDPAGRGPEPDLNPGVLDFIQFREDVLTDAAAKFCKGVRKGYSNACVSVQLGEGFRSYAADLANHTYYRYSKEADEIMHSHDFFSPPHNEPWHVADSVYTFIGTTEKPIILEIDGPTLEMYFQYTNEDIIAIAKAALDAGVSGLHVTNRGDTDPRTIGFVKPIAEMVKGYKVQKHEADSLFYVSKWTIYTLRRPNETLHDKQIFAYFKKLQAEGKHLRVVSDDNLKTEDLSKYKKLYISYSPVVAESAYNKLSELKKKMPSESDGPVGVHILKDR